MQKSSDQGNYRVSISYWKKMKKNYSVPFYSFHFDLTLKRDTAYWFRIYSLPDQTTSRNNPKRDEI